MRSRITNKLIPFGAYEDNQDHQEMMDTEAQIPQVQAGEAIDETLSSVMPNLAIPDVAPTDPNMDTEWLYDRVNITIASTNSLQGCKQDNISPDIYQQDTQTQIKTVESISPKLAESARPINIIQNLPYIKDCEFVHQDITQHMEQLQINPVLCSKCSPATKYFCSPEPVVQEPYKTSCHWKKAPESTLSVDIEPYKSLKNPCYHAESLGIQHPPNKRELRVFKSPNFGFKDTSSFAAAGKNKMCDFHQECFSEEPHKLSPEEQDQVTEILEKAVADDVLILSFSPWLKKKTGILDNFRLKFLILLIFSTISKPLQT